MPARLEDLILKSLEKDREVRSQTASELRADLKRLKRELDSDPVRSVTGPSATASAVSGGLETGEVRLTPNVTNDASSDARMAAALVKRHRGKVAVAAAAVILVLAVGIYDVVRRQSQPAPAASAAPAPSLEDFQVVQLTTSGNAETPANAPDGKYVAYVQPEGSARPGSAGALMIRQTATFGNLVI